MIPLADKCVQTVLGPEKDVTLVLVLTRCENICLLNYANMLEAVSTFFSVFNETLEHISDGWQIINLTRCLRLLVISVSSVCMTIQKERAAVIV